MSSYKHLDELYKDRDWPKFRLAFVEEYRQSTREQQLSLLRRLQTTWLHVEAKKALLEK